MEKKQLVKEREKKKSVALNRIYYRSIKKGEHFVFLFLIVWYFSCNVLCHLMKAFYLCLCLQSWCFVVDGQFLQKQLDYVLFLLLKWQLFSFAINFCCFFIEFFNGLFFLVSFEFSFSCRFQTKWIVWNRMLSIMVERYTPKVILTWSPYDAMECVKHNKWGSPCNLMIYLISLCNKLCIWITVANKVECQLKLKHWIIEIEFLHDIIIVAFGVYGA